MTDESRMAMYIAEYSEKILNEINLLNNEEKIDHPLKFIMELINTSSNDENLAKMLLPWNPWF